MSETPNLKLPYVAAAQAQKHVTVNEALARIDAALQLNVVSRTLPSPPVAVEGEVFLVPDNPAGDWADYAGALAFAIAGGWDFLTPHNGWRIWVSDEAKWVSFGGDVWIDGVVATTVSNAAFRAEVLEFDVDVVVGLSSVVSTALVPSGSVVFAVTGRILNGFDGTLSDWSLGVAGSTNHYGSGLGTATAAFVHGLTGQPQGYYADTPLILTANGGDFGSGTIRLAIHVMQFEIPQI